MEHQLDIASFIKKLFACCSDNGKVAITVPTQNGMVIEGHVTQWNAGQLMYDIIQSGYSCKNAAVKTYADQVSVIVPKEPLDSLPTDNSTAYFPPNMPCGHTRFGGVCFDGKIIELNW